MAEKNEIDIAEYKKLKLIYEIIKQFQGTLNLKVLMNKILIKVVEEINAEAGTFFLLDNDTKEIVCTEAIGPAREKVLNLRIPYGTGVVGWCINTKKPTIIYDTSKDKRFQSNVDDKSGFVTKSIICVPIVYEKNSLGAVEIFNKKNENGQFNDHDMDILKIIADNAGASLVNAQTHNLETRLKERSMIMNDFARAFNSTLELETLLDMVLKKIIDALDCEAGSIWLIDEKEPEKIICKIAEGESKGKIIGVKLPVGTGIVGSVVENKKMEIVLDAENDERFSSKVDEHTGFKTHSMLCMPLIDNQSAIGCVQAINKKTGTHKFNRDEVDLLESVTSIASMSIKNAKMFEKEKKIGELSALLQISKDINSSLDIDSVSVSIVNLTRQLFNYDRSILLIESKPGKYTIAAVSDMAGNFSENKSLNKLVSISGMILENKKENYFRDISEYKKQPAAVGQFIEYFDSANINSFYCRLLNDSEGNLGILIFESRQINVFPEDKKEAMDILFNQAAVSLRNSQLYRSVPKFDLFGSKDKSGKKRSIKFKIAVAAIIIFLIIAAGFVKINYNLNTSAEIVPLTKKFIYPQVEGLLKEVFIKDGDIVKKGDPIAKINDNDLKIQLQKLKDKMVLTEKDILKFKTKNLLLELETKEIELNQTIENIKEIENQIEQTLILSPISGQVILKDASSKLGQYVSSGSKFAEIVDLKKIKVKLMIPEEKISKIRKGMEINVKFPAFPLDIINGKIEYVSVESEKNEISKLNYYPAYFSIENKNEKLRISMAGNGRIKGDKVSILSYLLESPINYIYMNYIW
ncbi:GAF domain-containing protein [Candidatus Dependentiae bacterium]|nr:GAF domain-containing protein [Candidatus Dependentiae bacterium]